MPVQLRAVRSACETATYMSSRQKITDFLIAKAIG